MGTRKPIWMLSLSIILIWILAVLIDARPRSEQQQQQLSIPHHKSHSEDKHSKARSQQPNQKNRKKDKKDDKCGKSKKDDKHKKNKKAGKKDSSDKKKGKHNKGRLRTKKHHYKKGTDKAKGSHGSKRPPHKQKVGGEGTQHSFEISDISCGPGRDVMKCPEERPCCSQWGYCGNDGDYCAAGCQKAFGECGFGDDTVRKHKHRHRKHKPSTNAQHGFIKGRQSSLPGQDGRQFRISSNIPKLPPNGTLVNIAYFPGWTQYRGQGRNNCHQRPYLPSAIPWSSLDYVMFAFVYFDNDYQLYPADPSDEALYFQVNQLKMPTNTRVMISIGGWSFTHPERRREEDTRHRFENMIASVDSRKAFIESCIEFCQFYGFDGVDIDYEYPAAKDRDLVTALFQEMRAAIDAEGSGLVLSLAGASFVDAIQGFDLEKVAAAADFVMIMAYDLYGSDDLTHLVNIHTALVQMPTENHGGHSVQGAVELYLDRGVPRQKLVLGLALYGKTFLLADAHQQQPGRALFTQGGDPSSCIETRGDMAYNEISTLLHPTSPQQPAVVPRWDPDGKVFYFVYGHGDNNWVGYDDRPSLDLKLQLVTEADLAGVMWWSLDQDLDSTSEESALFTKQKPKNEKKGGKSKNLRPRGILQVPFLPPQAEERIEEPTTSTSVVPGDELSSQLAGATDPSIPNVPSPSEPTQIPSADYLVSASPSSETAGKPVEGSVPTSCPPIHSPPSDLSSISLDILGRPGLVPYISSKRERCNMVVNYPHVLPDTPVGNVVMTRCLGPDHCPESWRAYTCSSSGWSDASPCFAKSQLSPSLYFYGELDLIRVSARDRDIKDVAGPGTSPSLISSKLSAQIGSKRPEYIEHYMKLSKLEELMAKAEEAKAKKKVAGGKSKKSRSKAKLP
ncbi:chitinase [Entomortierella parvispora]|uniref:Chitinase n=1 Tax=Entomortierella parvispora TaxID=205924 RepID=A0A9P3M012_9FUNG|nr:chitinase [Entomortierella parvispora]